MTARRILVIGQSGQLAQALAASGRAGLVLTGRPQTDLSSPPSLQAVLEDTKPDVVINAAAYTFVDKAESEPEAAFAVNRDGPAALADLCAQRNVPLIHVSTDCVFDGQKASAYVPGDPPAPLGVYGWSKWEGEQRVAQLCPRHLNVRVSWVFSEYAASFVRTMLTLAATREEVTVVCDQVGYPTYCPDLASGLLKMADAACDSGFSAWGTYHLAGMDAIDRARMAELIFAESARLGGPSARVKAVATAGYPTPARRPLNCQLDSAKALQTFGIEMPDWKEGLARTVRVLIAELSVGPRK